MVAARDDIRSHGSHRTAGHLHPAWIIIALSSCNGSDPERCCSDSACPAEVPESASACNIGGGVNAYGTPRAICLYCDNESEFQSGDHRVAPVVDRVICKNGAFENAAATPTVCEVD